MITVLPQYEHFMVSVPASGSSGAPQVGHLKARTETLVDMLKPLSGLKIWPSILQNLNAANGRGGNIDCAQFAKRPGHDRGPGRRRSRSPFREKVSTAA
jgi:hypothetical protein